VNQHSCIQDQEFNFVIDHRDDYFIYTDRSSWISSTKLAPESTYELEIINGTKSNKFTVPKNLSTIIKYTELPVNCDLPCNFDGVYTFKVVTCQNTQEFERYEAILENVLCAYDQLIYKDDWENAKLIMKYIEYVKSYSRRNMLEYSSKYYELLMKTIKKLNCNC